jgi:hypothetical protein
MIRLAGADLSPLTFSVDREASDRRKAGLESYLAASVWNPREGFVCASAVGCRSSAERRGASFYEAQGHMVGPCYDLHADGKPYRVLVLPMETAQLARFRGREVSTSGDGFLAMFDGPQRAIRCAMAIRDAVQLLGIEVRAGLHTGECEVRGDDISGIAVHIGARVSALPRTDRSCL